MKREKPLYAEIMKAVSKIGGRVFRNNTGLLYTQDGRPCRVGLVNGGSDLIGWMPFDDYAIFTSIEVKSPHGKPTEEQKRFLDQVKRAGGLSCLAYSVEDVLETYYKFKGKR